MKNSRVNLQGIIGVFLLIWKCYVGMRWRCREYSAPQVGNVTGTYDSLSIRLWSILTTSSGL